MHLILEGEFLLAVAAFGGRRTGAQLCEIARVKMKTYDGPDVELFLFTAPYICMPFSVQPMHAYHSAPGLLSTLGLWSWSTHLMVNPPKRTKQIIRKYDTLNYSVK